MRHVTILLSCILQTTILFSQSPEPGFRIAYNVKDTLGRDNYEVFVMDADGKRKKNIINHADVAWSYYAFNDKVFFVSDRDTCRRCYFLYSMTSDGSGVKKISNLQLEDSWMSSRNDGREMVVSGRFGKELRHQLFIINNLTGDYKQITSDTTAIFRDPVFSPDGKQIVCAIKWNKRDKKAHEELFIMNDDGSAPVQLTHYPKTDTLLHSFGYKAGPPRWNAKLNIITYNSMQEGKGSLFAVTPDGKKQWRLTNHTLHEGWHDWSPDGEWLVFDGTSDEKQYDIYLMHFANKKLVRLTDNSYHVQQAPVVVPK